MSPELPITEYIDTQLNTIPSKMPISEAGRKMVELGVDSVLVMEDGKITGIITQRDIMRAISKDLDLSRPSKDIVSKPLITIADTAKVGEAIKLMRENNTRRLVVTKDSKPIGTITQKKIFGNLSSKSFEIPELEMPKKIKCPYCLSLFDKKEELSKHIDQVHIGYGVFQGNFERAGDLGSISPPDSYPKSI